MPNILSVSLADILPHNIVNAPNIPDIITALDPHIQSLSHDSFIPLLLPEVDSLNENALDALALQYSAELYCYAHTLDMKRAVIKGALIRHMKKGTPYAITEGLKTIGIDAEFIPWWEFDGEPYTFRIRADITGDFYRGAGRDKITSIITNVVNESKSARSLMTELDTRLSFSELTEIYHAGFDVLTGRALITPMRDYHLPHNVVYYGHIHYLSGCDTVSLERITSVTNPVFAGNILSESWSSDLCCGLDTMQELLLQFEKRIFERIDNLERSLRIDFDTRSNQLDGKINDVLDLLRWKDED